MTDPERTRRVGLNEAMFREINERLEELAHASSARQGTLDLVCECGDRNCGERLTLTVTEYRELRSDPLHFAVLPGHEIPQVEDVVDRRGRWLVVRKHEGEAAAIAREMGE